MIDLRGSITFVFLFFLFTSRAQTLGGNAAYNFLKLSSSPLLTAGGGVNVSYKTNEVGFAVNNPALLHPDLSNQLNASFTNLMGAVKTYSLSGAHQYAKAGITAAGHVHFIDYGSIPQTDAAGNIAGHFRPVDFLVQASASKKYLSNWNYGLSVKFIGSSYQQYQSNAVAFDVGVHYHDSANQFSASILARNMGFQLSSYAGEKEDLPFDLQVGLTKRLENAPFGFSITTRHLHRFDITYNDRDFNEENGFSSANGTFDKIFNHFVLASHIYIGNHLEATIGFNALKRNELSIGSVANGLTGFSGGLRLKFQKLQVLYARSQYQRNMAQNQFGITMHFDQLGGIGK